MTESTSILPTIAPLAPASGAATAAPPVDSLAFRRLLERLDQVAAPKAGEVHDVDDLTQAMRGAADAYGETMELRRAIEAAFRART